MLYLHDKNVLHKALVLFSLCQSSSPTIHHTPFILCGIFSRLRSEVGTMISGLLVTACVFVVGFAYTIDDCPSHLHRHQYLKVFGDKCYRFLVNQKKDFEEAVDYCDSYNGGYLALVKTKEINAFIRNTVKEFHDHGSVWIGLRYDPALGLVWEDGSTLSYHNFGTKESSLRDDCALMRVDTGKWYTHDCNSYVEEYAKHYFVCEYPIDVSNNQSTIDDCPKNLTRDNTLQLHNDTCYRFVVDESEYKTFTDAQRDCEKDNGHLAEAKSSEINEYFERVLDDTFDLVEDTWIGLRYDANVSDYKWMDGSVLGKGFSNFGDEEDKDEECVGLSWAGGWDRMDCDDEGLSIFGEKSYICEYKPTPPSRTTMAPTTVTESMAPTTVTESMAPTTVTESMATETARPTTDVPTTVTVGTEVYHSSTTQEVTTERKTHPTEHTNTNDPSPAPSSTPTAPSCPEIVCELDCGMAGYATDVSGCIICDCLT